MPSEVNPERTDTTKRVAHLNSAAFVWKYCRKALDLSLFLHTGDLLVQISGANSWTRQNCWTFPAPRSLNNNRPRAASNDSLLRPPLQSNPCLLRTVTDIPEKTHRTLHALDSRPTCLGSIRSKRMRGTRYISLYVSSYFPLCCVLTVTSMSRRCTTCLQDSLSQGFLFFPLKYRTHTVWYEY